MSTSPITSDLASVIAAARAAQEAIGQPVSDESAARFARHQRLKDVLDSLPIGMRAASRSELESHIDSRILAAVLGWHRGHGNLVLMGATSVGKTSGAVHLVRRLCHEGAIKGGEAFKFAELIRWQSCRELSELVRETRFGTGTPQEITRCQNARLLILNDVGTDDDKRVLERVLDARYERKWPTVTTTGLSAKQLGDVFGDALTRRVFECGPDRGRFVEIFPPQQTGTRANLSAIK